MLRPWPTSSLTSLTTLSLLLACSSAGTDQNTDSLSPSTTDGATSAQETTNNPSTDPSTTPTTTVATTDNGLTTGGSTFTGEPSTSVSTTDPAGTTSDPDTTATASGETGSTTGNSTTGNTTNGTTTIGDSSSTGVPEGCDDGAKNGDETDIDCGGTCGGCDLNGDCTSDTDCLSGSCDAGTCIASTCDDAKKNGSETDIDCGGGECDACLDGETCELGDDCVSGVCDANVCLAAACDDVVQNGDETDIDCGGGTCDGCGSGLDCVLPDDCQSGVCTDAACVPPSCSDSVQNGLETGIDCGGNNCAPCQLMGLILNEVDYDNIGDDVAEFVEIYNNTGATVDLANIRLVLVNGSNNLTYLSLSLAAGGMLMQGQYLVVGPAALVAPPGVVKVNFVAVKDSIQNGSPDGIALVDTAAMKVLDALSYEGPMTMTTVTGVPGVTNLVEGMALNANVQDSNDEQRALIRFPNGNDKDNAATDWIVSKKPTPGTANVP